MNLKRTFGALILSAGLFISSAFPFVTVEAETTVSSTYLSQTETENLLKGLMGKIIKFRSGKGTFKVASVYHQVEVIKGEFAVDLSNKKFLVSTTEDYSKYTSSNSESNSTDYYIDDEKQLQFEELIKILSQFDENDLKPLAPYINAEANQDGTITVSLKNGFNGLMYLEVYLESSQRMKELLSSIDYIRQESDIGLRLVLSPDGVPKSVKLTVDGKDSGSGIIEGTFEGYNENIEIKAP